MAPYAHVVVCTVNTNPKPILLHVLSSRYACIRFITEYSVPKNHNTNNRLRLDGKLPLVM